MTTETKRYVIEGFENLTPQEVFDKAARHVIANGEQNLAEEEGREYPVCSYKGKGCAAAVFLTEEARQTLVGSWSRLWSEGFVPGCNYQLIVGIQQCHDSYASFNESSEEFLRYFADEMECVADNYGLSTKVLEDAGLLPKPKEQE